MHDYFLYFLNQIFSFKKKSFFSKWLSKRKTEKRRKESTLAKSWLQRRPGLGVYDTLLPELRSEDEEE